MARRGRRQGHPVHGWLILDKPQGMTSTAALGAVKRLVKPQKAGHAGTLDPLATGVLPIAFGEATKTVPYVMDGDKGYEFRVRFGAETNTDDAEGEIRATSERRPETEEIEAALPRFIGTIEQVPPAFSAIKVGGERAYDLAREGAEVALAPRAVEIYELTLIERPDPDHAILRMTCGKGTYVRALARDLARALGTCGHVDQIRRTQVGPFLLAHAITLDHLLRLADRAPDQAPIHSVATALDDIPALAVSEAEASRLRQGQSLSLLRRSDLARTDGLESGDLVCAMAGDQLVAIANYEAGELRPLRVLNL